MRSIPVVIGLVRTVDVDADVAALLFAQQGEVGAELLQMQACDFFVKLFWQRVDLLLVAFPVVKEFNLRKHLVGERA